MGFSSSWCACSSRIHSRSWKASAALLSRVIKAFDSVVRVEKAKASVCVWTTDRWMCQWDERWCGTFRSDHVTHIWKRRTSKLKANTWLPSHRMVPSLNAQLWWNYLFLCARVHWNGLRSGAFVILFACCFFRCFFVFHLEHFGVYRHLFGLDVFVVCC